MRKTTLAAATASVIALGLALTVWPADAATKKRVSIRRAPTHFVVRPLDTTRITTIGEDGRVQTRYVAVRRTYLDPGTEVSPGELPFHDFTMLPAYSPTSNIDVFSPSGSFRRQPLGDPWDFPSFPKY